MWINAALSVLKIVSYSKNKMLRLLKPVLKYKCCYAQVLEPGVSEIWEFYFCNNFSFFLLQTIPKGYVQPLPQGAGIISQMNLCSSRIHFSAWCISYLNSLFVNWARILCSRYVPHPLLQVSQLKQNSFKSIMSLITPLKSSCHQYP